MNQITIKQKFPGCFILGPGEKPIEATFTTLEEFYNIPFISSRYKLDDFIKFSLYKPQYAKKYYLMAEHKNYEIIIAYFIDGTPDLPKYEKKNK